MGRDVAIGLYAAWRILRLDRSIFDAIPNTASFALHSFLAALLLAPLAVVDVILQIPEDGAGWSLIVSATALYIIAWTAFPVLMISLTRWMHCYQNFYRFLGAYNWFKVPQNLIMLPFGVLAISEAVASEVLMLPMVMVFVGLLFYKWRVIRETLKVSGGGAAALVFIDLLLSLLIQALVLRLT